MAVVEWRNGGVVEWWSGGVVEWSNGEMEEWRCRVVQWWGDVGGMVFFGRRWWFSRSPPTSTGLPIMTRAITTSNS